MPSFTYTPRLPLDSLILITGVNGLVASHTADQALKAGYRVRGTVRSVEKAKWMVDKFTADYGEGRFELIEVKDLSGDGAFDNAIKGMYPFSLYEGGVWR